MNKEKEWDIMSKRKEVEDLVTTIMTIVFIVTP